MLQRVIAAGLIQTALLGFGLHTRSSQAAEFPSEVPIPPVTNVVARRIVGDTIQTLLRVTTATNPPAAAGDLGLSAQPAATLSIKSDPGRSNTNWAMAAQQAGEPGVMLITNPFAGFVAGSLASTVWGGLHLEGRSTNIWEFWQLPAGWPTNPPILRWNRNNLMWGRRGMTAISQVCEGMGAFGQGAITALTPRHAYLRGHGMGPSGLHPEKVGRRVWYCTQDNRVIERKVQFLFVRAYDAPIRGDYSIILFDADLPAAIKPMRVADEAKVRRKYFFGNLRVKPVFMPLQGGFVSAGVADWIVPVRGGDSGAPNMLPLPGELVFIGGISTSPPSAQMQADMDMLSRKAGLNPRKYQMQWVNLDRYPDF